MTDIAAFTPPTAGQVTPTATITLGTSSTALYGLALTETGAPQVGAVSFRPVIVDASGHITAAGAPVTATLNVVGRYAVRLFCTDDPATTPGTAYLLTEPAGNAQLIAVPATTSGVLGLRSGPLRSRPTAA